MRAPRAAKARVVGLVGVACMLLDAPAFAAPAPDRLLFRPALLDAYGLEPEDAPEFTPPAGPDCRLEAAAQAATEADVVAVASGRWVGPRDRAAEIVVTAFATPRAAKRFVLPYLDTDVSEECVEYRLQRDAPVLGTDVHVDDREVDVGKVPTAAFLAEGRYDAAGEERQTLTEKIVVRVGVTVIEAAWTARRAGFPELAGRFERATRAIVRRAAA